MQKTLCFVIDTLIPVYQKQQVTCGYFSGSTALRMKVYEGASIEGTKTINELPRQHIHCHNFCYIDVALKALLLNIWNEKPNLSSLCSFQQQNELFSAVCSLYSPCIYTVTRITTAGAGEGQTPQCRVEGVANQTGDQPSVTNIFWMVLLSYVLAGLGSSALFPLGYSYIDDHSAKHKSAMYIGEWFLTFLFQLQNADFFKFNSFPPGVPKGELVISWIDDHPYIQ